MRVIVQVLCSALVLLTAVFPVLAAERADMILLNGRVLTVDPAFSIRSTVVIKEGKILAVGGPELARRYTAPNRIDLQGRTLMPGFIDTHLHLFGLSHRAIEADKAASIADLQRMTA